jgi:hypothetical protein
MLDSTNSPGPDHSGRAFFVCPIYEKPRRLRRGEEPHSRSSQLTLAPSRTRLEEPRVSG